MENYNVDSHKLMFHPDRVAEWISTKDGYPINAEIAISGACNHRCIFCSVDYTGYIPEFLEKNLIHERMKELHVLGLKSVLLAGNGEPLVNKDAVDIINDMKVIGLDVALSTNGVLFTKKVSEACLESLSWIRFSVSAGKEETYKKIHRGQDGDLNRVFQNIADAAEYKKKYQLKTVLGVQIVMTPENEDEILILAQTVKDLGADLFTVKSLGWFPNTQSELKEKVDRKSFYSERENLSQELQNLCDEGFSAVYRSNRAGKVIRDRQYKECFASPFHICIDSAGRVVPCCSFMGVPDMSFGNIKEQTFEEIWHGNKRKDVLRNIKECNLKMCPVDCKLDNMNRYLYELVCPGPHVNFI